MIRAHILLLSFLAASAALGKPKSMDYVDNINAEFEYAMKKFQGVEGAKTLLRMHGGEDPEMAERKSNFRKTLEMVHDINDNNNLGYYTEINSFSVMTDAEKRAMMNLNVSMLEHQSSTEKREKRVKRAKSLQAPSAVDWVKKGGQPPVKSQGGCGSCWAFAATSAIEGRYFALTGELVSFSDQEILDCTYEETDHTGCEGGWMHNGFKYVMNADRLANTADVSYKARDGPCDHKKKRVRNALKKAALVSWEEPEWAEGGWAPGSDSDLLLNVAEGVVSVAILAGNEFSSYRSGVFECRGQGKCGYRGSPNHAVTVTGYKPDYWIVRNSWGETWGEKGYIWMSRGQPNIIGIADFVMIPVFECRPGQKCTGNDDKDEDEDEDEGEDEFDIGKVVESGEIRHGGGLCVDLAGPDKKVVLTSLGCSRKLVMSDKGYIQDSASKKCIVGCTPYGQGGYLRFVSCENADTWKKTTSPGFQSMTTGLYWQPDHGSSEPPEDTPVVNSSKGGDTRLTFAFSGDGDDGDDGDDGNDGDDGDSRQCWEERSMVKKVPVKKAGKPMQFNKLDDAKDGCAESDDCKMISKKKGKFNLFSLADTGDKEYAMVICSTACEAGQQRCCDGLCKKSCGKEEEGCSPGLVECDGECKHEHMCS